MVFIIIIFCGMPLPIMFGCSMPVARDPPRAAKVEARFAVDCNTDPENRRAGVYHGSGGSMRNGGCRWREAENIGKQRGRSRSG